MAGIANSAVLVHPGKPGKVQAGWHNPAGKHVRASSRKGTPDRAWDAEPMRHTNREAWIKLRARLDEKDFREAVNLALQAY